MAQTAEAYERRIYQALLSCSAQAKGLFLVMRYWSEQNPDRPGFVERDGRPMSRDALAAEARCSAPDQGPDPFHELRAVRDDDGQPVLVKQDGRTFVLPTVATLYAFRRRRAASKAKSVEKRQEPERVLRNTQVGVTGAAGNTLGNTQPPPMVSPPITPSSFPPEPIHPGGSEVGEPCVPDSLKRDTLAAFDRWSQAVRRKPLMPEFNEHKPLFDLLEIVMQDSPIARGREVVPRQNLVPYAADFCARERKPFPGAKYVAAVVRNLLGEWAEAKAVPAIGTPRAAQFRPTGTTAPGIHRKVRSDN